MSILKRSTDKLGARWPGKEDSSGTKEQPLTDAKEPESSDKLAGPKDEVVDIGSLYQLENKQTNKNGITVERRRLSNAERMSARRRSF